MKAALEGSLPSDLFEVYETVMETIRQNCDDTQELARKILSWIFYAKRPLKINELREAIAVREGDTFLEEDDLMQADEIIEVCGSLIDYDAASGNVTFSHETVQDFLKSRYSDGLLPRVDLCKACLTYMSFDVFKQGPCTDEASYNARLAKHSFGKYVAQYWGRHVKEVEEENPELYDTVIKVIGTSTVVDAMTQLAIAQKGSDWDIAKKHKGKYEMHIFAEQDLVHFAKKYLNHREVTSTVPASPSDCQEDDDTLEALFERLEKYMKVTICTNDGSTRPLHLAAQQGHVKMIEILLEAGAEVDHRNDSDETALHLACKEGHCEVVKLLLRAKASLEMEENDGLRPLHCAAMKGSVEIINALLEAGVQVDSKSHGEVTSFLFALSCGHLAAARRLREMNADICITTSTGVNTFHCIAASGNEKLFDLLPSDVEININGPLGRENWTPLHIATDCDNLDVVERLLSLGADLHISCDDGLLPLHTAAKHGRLDVVKVLLKANARPDCQCKAGRTALYLACREDHASVVETLLEAGADLHIPEEDGWVALHVAAYNNCKEIVEKLLEAGAHVDLLTDKKSTALSLALESGHINVVERLVKAGANPLISLWDGQSSPLRMALARGHEEMARVMLAKLGKPVADVNEVLPRNFEKLSTAAFARHQLLRHITNLFPGDWWCLKTLADFYRLQGLHDLAIPIFDRLLSLDSQNSHVTEVQDIIHTNYCDACRTDPIWGIRYRCVTCDDYDLCQDCMDQRPQPHNEHEFIRIPSEQWLSQHLNPHEAALLRPMSETIQTTERIINIDMDMDIDE